MNALRKAADPGRAVGHRHAGNALEQGGRNDQVSLLAGKVKTQTTQRLEHQVKYKGAGHAQGQYP